MTNKSLQVGLFLIAFLITFTISVSCQIEKICISQEAANKCRDLAKEKPLLDEKIKTLESALDKKDSDYEKLRAELVRVQIDLAKATGQLLATEAENVRLQKILEAILPRLRKKCNGIVLFC